jgi:tetratricopeptide (TPR) repeat protein
VAALVAAIWHLSNRPVLSFAPRDWILVSDVQNDTGDPVFDRALTTALRVGLEQSTVANVFSSGRVETTLGRMGRKGVEHIDETIGREICQREGLRGLVTASISQAGSRYAIAARIVDPATGDAVRSYLESANGRDGVLPALEHVSKRVRRDLGESLATMRQVDRPLPQVTTRSLEALQAFAEGNHLWNKGRRNDGVQLLERAVALDPEFAKAHAALGSAYMSFVFNERPKGRAHFETALKLSDRITDRERLEIEANYHSHLGHFEQASQLFAAFLRRYPDELRVQFNYANLLRERERYDEAMARYREVLRLDPGSAASHINIATSLVQLDRVAEALSEYERAFALEPTWVVSGNLNHEYGIALVRGGDRAQARAVFDKAVAAPGMKAKGLRSHALLDMLEGRYAAARARLEESALVNKAAREPLSEARDRLFLSIVLGAQGDRAASRRQLDTSAALLAGTSPPAYWVAEVGVGYVRAGELDRAREQLVALRRIVDETDPRQRAVLHRLEGEVALSSRKTDEAVEILSLANQEGLGRPFTKESLARAYVAAGQEPRAIELLRSLLESGAGRCLGAEPQQACLEDHTTLARLLARQGDAAGAQEVMDRLLALWKEADPVPVVLEARRLRRELDA